MSGRRLLLGLVLLVAVAASLVAAPGLEGMAGATLAVLMFAIAIIDSRRYVIPNELTGAAVVLALLRAGLIGPDADWREAGWAALGAAAAAAPLMLLMIGYRRWRGRDGLGPGDVKLAAVAGAWLGLVTVFAVIEIAALAALGVYVLTSARRNRPLRATAALPFGAFFAPAIWFGWLLETSLT